MYLFFKKHKFLRLLLDYIFLCTVGISIFYLFKGLDFSIAWFVPVYINMFVLCVFFYVDIIHEPKAKRMSFFQWLDNIRWINGIGLVLHVTTGYYTKYSHKQVIKSIWSQDKTMILLTISIYLIMILVPSILIYLRKKKRNNSN